MSGHGFAFRCGQCDAEPMWTISRQGDAVVSWACAAHLSAECDGLQRDHEVSRLEVVLRAKALEVAEINRLLDGIAQETPMPAPRPIQEGDNK